MKYIFWILIAYSISIHQAFAQDGGITGLEAEKLRTGDIQIDDIPLVLRNITDYGMGIAGTVAVIFVIIGGYQLLFKSVQWDKQRWKETIIMALTGFIIASLSRFIIKLLLDNLR